MRDTENCMQILIPYRPDGNTTLANHSPRIFHRCNYLVGRITKNGNVVEYARTTDGGVAVAESREWAKAYVFTICYAGGAPYLGASNPVGLGW